MKKDIAIGQGDFLRDTGAAAALANSHAHWMRRYTMLAADFLANMKKGEPFIGEDVRLYANLHGLEAPHVPQVWSAAFKAVLREWMETGKVVMFGTAKSRATGNHSSRRARYWKGFVGAKQWRAPADAPTNEDVIATDGHKVFIAQLVLRPGNKFFGTPPTWTWHDRCANRWVVITGWLPRTALPALPKAGEPEFPA